MASLVSETPGVRLSDTGSQDKVCRASEGTILRRFREREPRT